MSKLSPSFGGQSIGKKFSLMINRQCLRDCFTNIFVAHQVNNYFGYSSIVKISTWRLLLSHCPPVQCSVYMLSQRPGQTCPKPQKEFTQPVKCMALTEGSLNTLHGTALNCTAFNCFTQYSTEMFGVTLHFTVFHCTSLKIAAQYNVTLRRSARYYAALHFTVRYYTSLYGITLHCSSLNCTVRYETHVQSTVQYSELNLTLHKTLGYEKYAN